jgi:hypothetical protein
MEKIMNIISVVSWTDILTEVVVTSTICNQDSVRICSLDVKMNNTDEWGAYASKLLAQTVHTLAKSCKNEFLQAYAAHAVANC